MSEGATLQWCEVPALNTEELATAASWLHDMDPEYYALFQPEREQREAAVALLLKQCDSELGPTRFLRRDGRLVGLSTWFPASEVFARRMASLKTLLSLSSEPAQVKTALKSLPRPQDTLPSASLYLSKVCVDPQLRRSGLAQHMLEAFLLAGQASNQTVCLNVHKDNAAAIALYRKLGFALPMHTATASPYLLLTYAG